MKDFLSALLVSSAFAGGVILLSSLLVVVGIYLLNPPKQPLRLKVQPATPVPSHVQQHRLLSDRTLVWAAIDGKYHLGVVDGHCEHPQLGGYYHVAVPFLLTLKQHGTRWITDVLIWEADEMAGDIVVEGR